MEIEPYPEEQRCQNCSYAREIKEKINHISCRYGSPNIKPPHWPEVDNTAWCAKWDFNQKIKPETKEIIYKALTHPTNRVGHIETFTNDEKIVRKRIKEKYPEAVFEDEQKTYAIDSSNPRDPWGWSR
jgi:hypothetical protein